MGSGIQDISENDTLNQNDSHILYAMNINLGLHFHFINRKTNSTHTIFIYVILFSID